MIKDKILIPPLSEEDVLKLRIGDQVKIDGVIYTARDAAHKRMAELIEKDRPLPFDIRGAIIYYVGPTPAKEGRIIGSAGPTTSSRMDSYTPALLRQGLKGMIGKGNRSAQVLEAMKEQKAVYFVAVGGAGVLIARSVVSCKVIAYEDLGPEAIHQLEVKNFQVVVANDAYGGDLFQEGIARYRKLERN